MNNSSVDSSGKVLPFNDAANRQTVNPLDRLCRSKILFRKRYRILRPLGRGGFGVTYLCRDMVLPGNPLCVTKLLAPKVNNPDIVAKARERFEREAKILGQLGGHSHIPRLLDYFELDGKFYLVQEYVRGHNLAKEVQAKGIQSEQAVRQFLREILPILSYVHSNNVIHRDIKPPNIIRCRDDNRLVLIDFGAVKEQITQLSNGGASEMTTQFVGTVGFAPPEQLALRPTFSSDLYSIGVTCLYLLTGKPPLEFEYDVETGEIKWQDDVPVSPFFRKVLTKMLRIAPPDRYQTSEEVMRALALEAHLDDLAGCMNTKTPNPEQDADGLAIDPVIASVPQDHLYDDYVSPIAKRAQAIRRWKQRAKKRQQRDMRRANRTLVKSTYLQP